MILLRIRDLQKYFFQLYFQIPNNSINEFHITTTKIKTSETGKMSQIWELFSTQQLLIPADYCTHQVTSNFDSILSPTNTSEIFIATDYFKHFR